MDISLPEQLIAAIDDICRKTKKEQNEVIVSILGLAVEVAPYNDLVLRYVCILKDPEMRSWAEVIHTILDRAVPSK